MLQKRLGMLVAGVMALSAPAIALAHGFAGKRFFPSTLTVNNPFVNDELGLRLERAPKAQDRPLSGHSGQAGLTTAAIDFSKRLTRRLQVSVSDNFIYRDPRGGASGDGLGNVVLGVRLQGPVRADAQAAVSAGLNVEIGGTGNGAINNDSYTTFSPTFNFAKGFGALPQNVRYLRPLALTGAIAYNYPTRGPAPQTLDTGFTLQYSLQYLQSMMKNAQLAPVVRNLIPVVEFPFRVCLNQHCGGALAGTVNPGLIWATKYWQMGLEAAFPVDDRSGEDVGGLLQFRAYFNQIFPHSIGAPVFGQVFNKTVE